MTTGLGSSMSTKAAREKRRLPFACAEGLHFAERFEV